MPNWERESQEKHKVDHGCTQGVLGKDVFPPRGARKKNTQIAFILVIAFVANPLLDQLYRCLNIQCKQGQQYNFFLCPVCVCVCVWGGGGGGGGEAPLPPPPPVSATAITTVQCETSYNSPCPMGNLSSVDIMVQLLIKNYTLSGHWNKKNVQDLAHARGQCTMY